MMAEAKNRHGCLAAWLVLIIIVNSLGTLGYLISLLGRDMIYQMLQSSMYQSQMSQSQILQIQTLLNTPIWVYLVSVVFSIFNVVCAIALFLWKKWGFWGFCVSSAAALTLNLSLDLSIGISGISQVIYSSLFSLALVLVLFGVLHIGKKENKGWSQLK